MVAEFSQAVQAMENGQHSEAPVQTQFGWHVIILDDSRESTVPSFEQVKPQLQAFVQKQRVQQYIDGLHQGVLEMIQKTGDRLLTGTGDENTANSGLGEVLGLKVDRVEM